MESEIFLVRVELGDRNGNTVWCGFLFEDGSPMDKIVEFSTIEAATAARDDLFSGHNERGVFAIWDVSGVSRPRILATNIFRCGVVA